MAGDLLTDGLPQPPPPMSFRVNKYSLQNKHSIVEPLKLDHIESITRCVFSKQWSMSLIAWNLRSACLFLYFLYPWQFLTTTVAKVLRGGHNVAEFL